MKEVLKRSISVAALLLATTLVLSAFQIASADNEKEKDKDAPTDVRNVDNPDRLAVRLTENISLTGASSASSRFYVVPAGRRLVIECVSVRAQATGSEWLQSVGLFAYKPGTLDVANFLTINPTSDEVFVESAGSGTKTYGYTRLVKAYFDEDEPVYLTVGFEGGTQPKFVTAYINGYLIEVN